MSVAQLSIDFTPGLLEQFPSFDDVLRASVYGCGRPLKMIAADLDMTANELTRKLADNPNDPVNFPTKKLADVIAATGDTRPIQWLVAKFLDDPESKRRHALDQINVLAPIFASLVEQAGLVPPKGKR
jgi:Phage regulatory protein CII (CP76)